MLSETYLSNLVVKWQFGQCNKSENAKTKYFLDPPSYVV